MSLTGMSGMTKSIINCACVFLSIVLSFAEEVDQNLLNGLASDDFNKRELSQKDLYNWVSEVPARIQTFAKVLKESDDPEIQMRGMAILKAISDDDYLKSGKGYLGIQMGEEIVPNAEGGAEFLGIRISFVVRGTPAEAAGLRRGDLIISLNGEAWKEAGDMQVFMAKIADMKPLQEVVLKVKRGEGEELEIPVRLGRRPFEDLAFGYGDDAELLDQKAREKHFNKWLKEQGVDLRF